MEGKINLVDHDFSKQSVKMGKNVNIHPEAVITGPAYIGDNVTIEAKTVINNSVIGNNVCIGYESKIIGSVVWDDIIMRKGVKIKNIVLTPSSVHYD
jgi:NDP-sugar pyrophosphorylase family protein